MEDVDYHKAYKRARDSLLGSMALLITIVIAFIEKFPLTISFILFAIACGILLHMQAFLQSVSNPSDRQAVLGVLYTWCLVLAHSIAAAIVLPLVALTIVLSHPTGSLKATLNTDLWTLIAVILLASILHVYFRRTLFTKKEFLS